VDEEVVAHTQAAGLFTSTLSPSVRAGRDLGDENNVGEYTGDFSFEGNLQNISLELK
jgi:hypothetical protein